MKRKSNRKIIVAGKDDSPAMLMNAVWALVHLKKSVVLCEILQVKIVEQ